MDELFLLGFTALVTVIGLNYGLIAAVVVGTIGVAAFGLRALQQRR